MAQDLDTRPHGIALVVSDVDGTLLTPDKRLTARTALAVRRLRAEGIHFALASSRPPFGLASLVGPLELTTPLVACNGAVLARAEDLEILEQRTLPGGLVHDLLGALTALELDVRLYRADDWFVTSLRDSGVGNEIRNLGSPPVVCADLGRVAAAEICKLVAVGPPEQVQRGLDLVRRDFRGRTNCSRSHPDTLDLVHPLADKGRGIRMLAASLGIPLERVAVIGDSEADLSMFRTAGVAITVANAPVEIRRAADRTAPSNSADGVAAALESWVLPLQPSVGHVPEQP